MLSIAMVKLLAGAMLVRADFSNFRVFCSGRSAGVMFGVLRFSLLLAGAVGNTGAA